MRGFLVVTAGNGLYKLSPKKTGGRAFLTGPACPCWSSTLASQLNKLCFGGYLLSWLSVSQGNRTPVPNSRRVWEQARTYADEVHQTSPAHPTGALVVPDHDPNWDYNTQAGLTLRDQFATCQLAGLKQA
jgi:hypothetical protein